MSGPTVYCDFCLPPTQNAVWFYACQSFASSVLVAADGATQVHLMDEAWAACDLHADLIEQGLDALLAWGHQRLIELHSDRPPHERDLIERSLYSVWRKFFANRVGPRRAVTAAEAAEAPQAMADKLEDNVRMTQWIQRHMG